MTVVAEVVRNGFVESVHHGSVLALSPTGQRIVAIGDVAGPLFPRSCAKPLQTLGMLEAGWAPDDDEQVALATASHSGTPEHVAVVRRILAAAGLDEAALDNTPDLPLDAAAARELLAAGGRPDALHQNCSGKHAAMVATCVAVGWSVQGYRQEDHPLQRALRATIERVSGEPIVAVAVDGCGAPLFSTTLPGLARAFVALAQANTGAASRVAHAMRAYPMLVGGPGRDVTALLQAVDGIVAKDGAEGVYAAALPDGRAVVLKIDDGAGRARAPVMVAALRRLGVDAPGLAALAATPVLGHGQPVGEVSAVLPDN